MVEEKIGFNFFKMTIFLFENHPFLMEGLSTFLKTAISHYVFLTSLGPLRTECYVWKPQFIMEIKGPALSGMVKPM